MDRDTHCPNCFKEPAPAPCCQHCGFDADTYSEINHFLPLFTPLAGGEYIVGRVLGEGGFGIVYAGFDQNLNRQIAIKEFFPYQNPLAERQGMTVIARYRCEEAFDIWKENFFQEARLLAEFDYPRLVRAYAVRRENNTAYLVMERLTGCTLSEYLGGLKRENELLQAGHNLPSSEVLSLLQAALEVLEVLHEHQPKPVIHRDLTPYNLFLVDGRPEQLKVLDFGLARLGERPQGIATAAAGVGNPAFASPEQLGIYPADITSTTDFYTLGASLYTALAGVAPPDAKQRCSENPPRSLDPLPNVDLPTLAEVIRVCLEISPKNRPQNVADIRRRLAAATVLPPLDLKPVTPPEPDLQPAAPTSAPVPTPNPRYRIPLILTSLLLILIATAAVVSFVNREKKLSPPESPVASVSPAPSTPAPHPVSPSAIQTPTLAPPSDTASQEEKSSPPKSPVASISPAPSTPAPPPVPPSAIQTPTLAPPGEAALQNAEELYARNGDEGEALPFYQQAAAAGNPMAKAILALWSQESIGGLAKSPEEAQRWAREALPELRRLADQGDPRAKFHLGILYMDGLGVPKDEKQAVEWYRKAAEQGYALAQSNLGGMYAIGLGVDKNYEQALAWYRKAAEQGLAIAQTILAIRYEQGRGVPKDDTQAVEWYRKAAEQGNVYAQYKLGSMLYATSDKQQAVQWLRKAAEQGNTSAKAALKRLEKKSR
ncbi:MAG: protein kinase [Candidatus Contendobacter sp.]